MSLGSMVPERVVPGRPDTGVRPMEVSRDLPLRIAQTDAPEPRCKTIRLVSEMSYAYDQGKDSLSIFITAIYLGKMTRNSTQNV